MDSKKLKLGKMTSKELAEWMGISYTTYQKNVQKRLEKLKDFAKFTQYRGYVIIEEIYIDEYVKNFNKDNKIYLREIKNSSNGLATLNGMARKITMIDREMEGLSFDTIRHRLSIARKVNFGDVNDPNSKGLFGTCCYVWAVKVDNMNTYRQMTEEEYLEYLDLCSQNFHQHFATFEEIALLQDAYELKEIDAETFVRLVTQPKKNFYKDVIKKMKEKMGITLVRTTYHKICENNFNLEEFLAKKREDPNYETIVKENAINLEGNLFDEYMLILSAYRDGEINDEDCAKSVARLIEQSKNENKN